MAKRPVPRYDFKAFGAAIKAARTGRKESRKKVSDEMFISPRYLANIENKGRYGLPDRFCLLGRIPNPLENPLTTYNTAQGDFDGVLRKILQKDFLVP